MELENLNMDSITAHNIFNRQDHHLGKLTWFLSVLHAVHKVVIFSGVKRTLKMLFRW